MGKVILGMGGEEGVIAVLPYNRDRFIHVAK